MRSNFHNDELASINCGVENNYSAAANYNCAVTKSNCAVAKSNVAMDNTSPAIEKTRSTISKTNTEVVKTMFKVAYIWITRIKTVIEVPVAGFSISN